MQPPWQCPDTRLVQNGPQHPGPLHPAQRGLSPAFRGQGPDTVYNTRSVNMESIIDSFGPWYPSRKRMSVYCWAPSTATPPLHRSDQTESPGQLRSFITLGTPERALAIYVTGSFGPLEQTLHPARFAPLAARLWRALLRLVKNQKHRVRIENDTGAHRRDRFGVMGRNLALNFERNSFWFRSSTATRLKCKTGKLAPCWLSFKGTKRSRLVKSLERPRPNL